MPTTESARRVLVLRSGALGDFILTVPVLRRLRDAISPSCLGLISHPRFARLAADAGLADETMSVDSADVARLYARDPQFPPDWRARIGSFGAALSFLRDPDGLVAANLRSCGVHSVLTHDPLPPPGVHAADHLSAALSDWGIAPCLPAVPALSIPHAGTPGVPTSKGETFVIHPGSGSRRKNWPLALFLRLAAEARRTLRLAPIFLAGEADEAAARALNAASCPFPVVTGLTLEQAADLLEQAAAYAGNDSGVSHLAAALGTPSVVLFGPTDPEQWAPRGAHVRILRAPAPADIASIELATVLNALEAIVLSRETT